jgi:hypothetical protein
MPEDATLLLALSQDQAAAASIPTFTDDVVTLGRLGLVQLDAEGGIRLTPRGTSIADAIRREAAAELKANLR